MPRSPLTAVVQNVRSLYGLTLATIALALGLLLATRAALAVLPMMPHSQAEEKPQASAPPPAPEAKQPRVDRFGDPLPEGVLARLGTMRFRHGRVTTLAFAPDGKSVLSCGADRTLRTWDLATGRLLREQRPPSEPTTPAFVLSRDGRLLAYQDATEGSFCLWDSARNQLRRLPWLLKGVGWQTGAFSPDGKIFAASSARGSLRIWEVATGEGRNLGKNDNSFLAFTADGKLLMTVGNQGGIDFWDLPAGSKRSHLDFSERFLGAHISPDGRIVAAWSYWKPDRDQGVRFWNAATGKPAKGWIAPRLKKIHTARFTLDGKAIVIAAENEVMVWDPFAGKRIRTLPGKTESNLTFSADGKTVAALVGGGPFFDPHGTMLRVWDLNTSIPRAATTAESGHLAEVNSVAFAPDGRTVASVCRNDGSVRLWDAATGRLLRLLSIKEKLSSQNQVLAFTPDGKYLLAGMSSTVVRWEVASGREFGRYPLFEAGKEDPQYLLLLQLTEDGRTLLAVCQNLRRGGYGSFASDVHAWDMRTGEHLRSLPLQAKDNWAAYGRFSCDGRWLALPRGGIHDAVTGKEMFHLSVAGKKRLNMPVVFSPNASLMATGVEDEVERDGAKTREVVAVQVWETATLLPVVRLESGEVAHAAFTPDGRRLITAGLDALKLWDLVSARMVARRPAPARFRGSFGPSFASCLAVAPNGYTVATGQQDTAILLWDLSPPRSNTPITPLTAAQREMHWNDLAGANAERAFASIARLADEPAQTVAMLRDRLHPAKAPSAEDLNRLIADLDHEKFERREAATGRLRELGELADTALRETLRRKPALESRRRIEGLLAEPPIVRVPEQRRQLRAVRVLDSIGTTEARQVLERLAEGTANSRLTREAKAALRRLTRRP